MGRAANGGASRAARPIALAVLAVALSGCSLWGWGNNVDGQIGDGSTSLRVSPSPAPPIFDNWLQLSTGEFHGCGVRFDSTGWCWGDNSRKQLGFDSPNDQALPVSLGMATWQAVDAGGGHSCGVRSDASMWCWGQNFAGQLGDGTTTPRSTPSPSGGGTWKAVSAANGGIIDGPGHTCGLRTNDTLWCWGGNSSGQLGDGTNAQRLSPGQVGSETWMLISTGAEHTCGIRSNRTLWCWGGNGGGRLGDGTTTPRLQPVQIGSALWKSVSPGNAHTCGVRDDNTLWCWGSSNTGQVGDGAFGSRFAPVQIGSATWSVVTAGGGHTCGIRTTGTLWCWGDNTVAQLGIGTQTPGTPSLVPVQVGTLARWHIVSAGYSHSNALLRP